MKQEIPHCLTCGHEQTRIVKLVPDDKGNMQTTQTFTWVCTNRACVFYINLGKVATWKNAVTQNVWAG